MNGIFFSSNSKHAFRQECLSSVVWTWNCNTGPTHQCKVWFCQWMWFFFNQQKCILATRFKAVRCEHEKFLTATAQPDPVLGKPTLINYVSKFNKEITLNSITIDFLWIFVTVQQYWGFTIICQKSAICCGKSIWCIIRLPFKICEQSVSKLKGGLTWEATPPAM